VPIPFVALSGMRSRNETYISAEQPQTQAQARIPCPDAHPSRTGDHQAPSHKGAEAPDRMSPVLVPCGRIIMTVPFWQLADPYAQAHTRPYGGVRDPNPASLLRMTPRRLQRSRDIRAVFAARNVARGCLMTVHATRRGGGPADDRARAVVMAGRDVGGAVQRNRAKRRLRAALAAESLPPSLDLVVRARPASNDAKFEVLQAELGELIDRVAAKCSRPDVRSRTDGGRR
jgi:ribonuclease P protein component